jgi:hypothetical protein
MATKVADVVSLLTYVNEERMIEEPAIYLAATTMRRVSPIRDSLCSPTFCGSASRIYEKISLSFGVY